MPHPRWIFKLQQPGDTTRDPISGEFFATEAIRNSAEALVREGIQNSLDASLRQGLVRVHIRLSGNAGAASPTTVAPFLEALGPHVNARGNGLRPELRPEFNRPCRFLVFEDFGTSGLGGDPAQWHKIDGVTNNFYAFFRAEGESAKSAGDRRGRWGIGKFVFPRASYGSAFFGYTVRAMDGRSLLLGRSILKSHDAGGARCVPDGYFGFSQRMEGGQLVTPIEDREILAAFRTAFHLERVAQPGLSLVVPWYDEEITEERLLEATVRDWFYSILAGELVVRVGEHVLDAASMDKHLDRLTAHSRNELEPLIGLTRFVLSPTGREPTMLGAADTTGAPKWHDGMLDAETAAALRAALDADRPIGVRIPLTVKSKPTHAESFLDVFMVRDAAATDGRPVFVREGVIVTDAKGGRARGYRSLVIIGSGPLADLLGDAEGPAHTEWRADTANFKEKYTHGPGYLNFVKQVVANLMERVDVGEEDIAPELLSDLFSLPEDRAEPPRRPKPGVPKPGDDAAPKPDLPPRRTPAQYRITRVAGGFTLTRGEEGAPTPAELKVTVAYDVRRGNPFTKHDPSDFRLFVAPIAVEGKPKGLAQIDASGNSVHMKVTDPDFRMSITGFDTNRDLIVRVIAKGSFGDNQAA